MRTARAFRRMEVSLDRSFAQQVKFTPLLKAESVSSLGDVEIDPARTKMIIDCVFEKSFEKYQMGRNFRGMRNDSFNSVIDDHPICLLRKGLLPYELAKGDQVELMETNELFVVADIKPDELGRILINLHNISESQI